MEKKKTISWVIPCFNEEKVILETLERIRKVSETMESIIRMNILSTQHIGKVLIMRGKQEKHCRPLFGITVDRFWHGII